jgi:integrase
VTAAARLHITGPELDSLDALAARLRAVSSPTLTIDRCYVLRWVLARGLDVAAASLTSIEASRAASTLAATGGSMRRLDFLAAVVLAALFTLFWSTPRPRASWRLAGIEATLGAPHLETMPRKPTGAVYESRGRWFASVTIAKGKRQSVLLATCADELAAHARCEILAGLAAKLRAADVHLDTSEQLLKRAGARDGKALAAVLEAADAVIKGSTTAKPRRKGVLSFEDVGKLWTTGALAAEYPDHVKVKKTADRDRQRLERYIYPHLEGVALAEVTLDHAEAIMKALPKKKVKTAATRRHVAQLIHRVLGLAVFPLRLLKANPLPRGFLPKIGPAKVKGWIYPNEDRTLLASPAVPLAWRVLYGFLDRAGPRLSEAAALDLADVDLERGAVKLEETKTNDPRAFALSPGIAPALAAWIAHREKATGQRLAPASPLFVDEKGERITGEGVDLAKRFRAHLADAGIDRAELFERTASRVHVRLHDLRATFVTISLANGRSETWVADRTGHRSSTMINRYRRAARTAAELGLGELARLDVAIPELAGPPGAGEDGPAEASPQGEGEPPGSHRGSVETSADTSAPNSARGMPEAATPETAADLDVGQPAKRARSVFESPNHGSNPCTGTG